MQIANIWLGKQVN